MDCGADAATLESPERGFCPHPPLHCFHIFPIRGEQKKERGGACVQACVRVCVRACVRACLCVCVHVRGVRAIYVCVCPPRSRTRRRATVTGRICASVGSASQLNPENAHSYQQQQQQPRCECISLDMAPSTGADRQSESPPIPDHALPPHHEPNG